MIDHGAIDRLARNIEQHAFRRGYVSAFTLAAYPVEQNEELTLHVTRECDGLVYGNAEVNSAEAFAACMRALDGRVDYIVHDTNLPFDISAFTTGGGLESPRSSKDGEAAPGRSTLLPYSDMHVWVESVRYMLFAMVRDLRAKNVLLVGLEKPDDRLGGFFQTLVASLQGCCGNTWVHYLDKEADAAGKKTISDYYKRADIVIGAAVYRQVIRREHLEVCEKGPLLVDAGIGTLAPEAAEYAREIGLRMVRVDNRAAMAGMLFSLIQSHDLVSRVMGRGEIDGIPVVAGGVIGAPGTIVVDSIDQPTIAIGFADGTGRIRYEPGNAEEAARIERVRNALGGDGPHG
jgi:hypothetical protein